LNRDYTKKGELMQQAESDLAAIEDQVRAYVIDSFLTGRAAATLNNDADLLAMLDSLQVLRMVLALEKQHQIKVHEGELLPENLGSIGKIAAFIARKLVESR
jgi:acyl carrier protein